jgi:hypothetical protein
MSSGSGNEAISRAVCCSFNIFAAKNARRTVSRCLRVLSDRLPRTAPVFTSVISMEVHRKNANMVGINKERERGSARRAPLFIIHYEKAESNRRG